MANGSVSFLEIVAVVGSGTDRLVMPTGVTTATAELADEKHKDPPGGGKGTGGSGGGGRGRLIDGLIEKVPTEGVEWNLEDRQRWLTLAAGIFDFVYKVPDNKCQRQVSES